MTSHGRIDRITDAGEPLFVHPSPDPVRHRSLRSCVDLVPTSDEGGCQPDGVPSDSGRAELGPRLVVIAPRADPRNVGELSMTFLEAANTSRAALMR